MKTSFKLTLSGILTALSLLAFMLENLFPPIVLPGARLGLANIFILLALILLGGRYAFIILILKTVLGSLFIGNISAVMYSLPSGLLSLAVESLLLYFVKCSILSVSACGSLINTAVQNATFCLITKNFEFMSYLPYLSLIGLFSGLLVGFAVYLAVRKLPLDILYKEKYHS